MTTQYVAPPAWEHWVPEWEYLDQWSSHDEDHWTKLGKEGWELVSVVPAPGTGVIGYFKRPTGNNINTKKEDNGDT